MHVIEVPITQLAAARMNGCNTRGTSRKPVWHDYIGSPGFVPALGAVSDGPCLAAFFMCFHRCFFLHIDPTTASGQGVHCSRRIGLQATSLSGRFPC